MRRLFKKKLSLHIVSFCIFLSCALYITFPLIFHLGDLTTGTGDEYLIAWIQAWIIHAITSGNFLSFFDANIFFPNHLTLAYSDLHLVSSLMGIIPYFITGQAIAITNFTIITSLLLLGFSIYLLSFYLTKDFFASVLAGALVIFSPAIFGYYVHTQMLAIGWVPLAMLSFLHFFKIQKSKYLAISLLFFTLQMYNSFLPGYFIIFSYFVIFLYNFIYNQKHTIKLITRKNIYIVLVTLLILLPIIVPYYQVSREFAYTRDIRESIHNALQPEDFVFPSSTTHLEDVLLSIFPITNYPSNAELHSGYIGFIFTVLFLFCLWYFIKHYKKNNSNLTIFLITAAVGLIVSFGPALHINRQTIHEPFPVILPYAFLYYIAPGFQGFRTPLRWEMLFIICMAIAIAFVLHAVLKKFSLKKQIIVYVILLTGIIAEFNTPLHFVSIIQKKDFPPVYSWLAQTSPSATMIEMPIYNWNMFPYASTEQLRDYYATAHFRKTVNGASGFSPPPWQTLVTNLLEEFPNNKSLSKLKDLKINYIVVHKKEYDRMHADKFIVNGKVIPSGDEVIAELMHNRAVTLEKQFNEDYVFLLKL